MATLIDMLRHLSPEEKKELEKVDNKIHKLQGKLRTYEDTLKLAELYEERKRIIRQEKKEGIGMPKAVLELPFVPESCRQCTLSTEKIYDGENVWVCAAFDIRVRVNMFADQRHPDCPLKIVEESEGSG